MSKKEVIAVFGATGSTGRCVVSSALKEGYAVQALARTPSKMEQYDGNDRVKVIQGDLSNEAAIQQTIKGATYVVSVAGGTPGGDKDVNKDLMQKFINILWPLMEKESSVKYFLYQAGAFCPKPDGTNPMMLKFMRVVAGWAAGISEMIEDHVQVMKFIDEKQQRRQQQQEDTDADTPGHFKTIIIRPGLLKDIPGSGGDSSKLQGSIDDSPPLGGISFEDLGNFIVQKAMKDDSLVGMYPFVSLAK